MGAPWTGTLEKIDDYRYRLPKSYKPCMRADGVIYADERLLQHIKKDQAPEQVANVACLPGIIEKSMAMPDIHWGYGFPIGGVAAFDIESGVISPGGVGYDINCGVRLLRTNLVADEVSRNLEKLITELFHNIPSGVGSKGRIRISADEVKKVLKYGARWAVKNGYGWKEDLEMIEENGEMAGADPGLVSKRALERGQPQLGTLGAGNHFLEVQRITDIYDQKAAEIFGLDIGMVTVMIHCGSRGLGYQICDDFVKILGNVTRRYDIEIPDRQLACAPIRSKEGKNYFSAMVCAANYAWANRQCIMHWVRQTFSKVLGKDPKTLGMDLIYDVAHNIAKIEEHTVAGQRRTVCVHRKGATRSFGPGHPSIPAHYLPIGQPVIIPGDMGSSSFLLLGTEQAMRETFGSTCHGAGRLMSRHEAIRRTKGRMLDKELKSRGILVRSASRKTLAEEAPEAYKDVEVVVDVCSKAGISKKVARMVPIGVIKG
ncbi:MAG TPA: RtcB family protein [bacterium (Candidatus Stahlbacteria)]|nr:RtcB family protein [Candidatus Stahlbacteria bacterium]